MKYQTLSDYNKKKAFRISRETVDSDEDIAFEISNKIIELRLEKGLTQKQLAEKISTKQSSIARIESGNYLPSISFLNKVARACRTHLEVNFEFGSSNAAHDSGTENVFFANSSELAQKSRVQYINSKTESEYRGVSIN